MNNDLGSVNDDVMEDGLSKSITFVGALTEAPWLEGHPLSDVTCAIYNLFVCSQTPAQENEFNQELAVNALYGFADKIKSKDVDTFISWMALDQERMQDNGYRECLLKLKTKMFSNAHVHYGENNTVQVLTFIPVYGDKNFVENGLIANFNSFEEAVEKGILSDFNELSDITSLNVVPVLLNPETSRHLENISNMNNYVSQMIENRVQSMSQICDIIKHMVGSENYWDNKNEPQWDFNPSVKDDCYSGLVPVWISFRNASSESTQKLISAASNRYNSSMISGWQNEMKKWFQTTCIKTPHSEEATILIHKPYMTSSAGFSLIAAEFLARFLKVCLLENNNNFNDVFFTVFDRADNKCELVLSSGMLGLKDNQLYPSFNVSCASMEIEHLDIIDASMLHEHISNNMKANGWNKNLHSKFIEKDTFLPPKLPKVEMLPDRNELKEASKSIKSKSSAKIKLH